jgi:hypothetical protein
METTNDWLSWTPPADLNLSKSGPEADATIAKNDFCQFWHDMDGENSKDMDASDEFAAKPWAEWFAASSNAAWVTEGALREPGRLSAATVRHGLDAYCRKKGGTVQ